jgi:hypothetical protein
VINFINKHEELKHIVSYHNINKLGIPPQFKNKISRVPTMLTKNGKFLVGNEIRNWLQSLLPVKELELVGFGSCNMTTLDGEGMDEIFELDSYGMSLQPAMTPELEEKINRSVSDAYNQQTKQ